MESNKSYNEILVLKLSIIGFIIDFNISTDNQLKQIIEKANRCNNNNNNNNNHSDNNNLNRVVLDIYNLPEQLYSLVKIFEILFKNNIDIQNSIKDKIKIYSKLFNNFNFTQPSLGNPAKEPPIATPPVPNEPPDVVHSATPSAKEPPVVKVSAAPTTQNVQRDKATAPVLQMVSAARKDTMTTITTTTTKVIIATTTIDNSTIIKSSQLI